MSKRNDFGVRMRELDASSAALESYDTRFSTLGGRPG